MMGTSVRSMEPVWNMKDIHAECALCLIEAGGPLWREAQGAFANSLRTAGIRILLAPSHIVAYQVRGQPDIVDEELSVLKCSFTLL